MTHSKAYFAQVSQIAGSIDCAAIESIVTALCALRARAGRVFVVGVGGSAANASHFVNDLRKLAAIEAYAPTDNVSELTARTNDEGWETVFSKWLEVSQASNNDALFVLSVGGGSKEHNISLNLVGAVECAKKLGMLVYGIVGRDGGYTKQEGDHVLLVPSVEDKLITPHTEAFQAVAFHCIISHPSLQVNSYKWEAVTNVDKN